MVQQFIVELNESSQDKGMKIASKPINLESTFRKSEGWSQDQINQVLEKRIRIQALKDNSNPLLGISPLFRERIIHDLEIVPFIYIDLPTQDIDQIDHPISPHRKFYIKFALLHPNDDPQTIIRTE